MSVRTPPTPFAIGPIHLVGIGGIGMSGIAELMHGLGYTVQGSDMAENANVKRLRAQGIPVHIGQRAENLDGAGVVVISSAIKPDNPELVAARSRALPVVRRAEMLAELMRLKYAVAVAGTHGKTTTTSIVAALLEAGGLDPTVIIGGIVNALGSNARLGQGDWMAVEADESDGTFIRIPATVAVITNIDPEHLDHWGDFDALRAAFRRFVDNLPFYGFAVACTDHAEVQSLIGQVRDRRVVTYGFNPQADLRGRILKGNGSGTHFEVSLSERMRGGGGRIADLRLPMLGTHNVQNALAAIAVAWELGLDADAIRAGLASFGGVGRRFTRVGEARGIAVFDDYGHHPVEIAAVLTSARQALPPGGRLIAVLQPHRYSRLAALFDEFCSACTDADTVLVGPVYAAGEDPLAGIDHHALVEGMIARGHRDARPLDDPALLAETIAGLAAPGDLVVCLGAGSVTQWAQALPQQLAALSDASMSAPVAEGGVS